MRRALPKLVPRRVVPVIVVAIIALMPIFSAQNISPESTTLQLLPPIVIDGDADFTSANGVNGGGDGTAANPYIIENWFIYADGTQDGITIMNTTAYFKIRNCLIKNSQVGIYLENVKNGTVEHVRISSSIIGILLNASSSNTLSGNTVENNSYGIDLRYSDNNKIDNNMLIGRKHGTAFTLDGNWNEITRNHIENWDVGIEVSGDGNKFYLNKLINNNRHVSPYPPSATSWDNGTVGNMWDTYIGTDNNYDGIGDTPYVIGDSNIDNCPIISAYNTAPTQVSPAPNATLDNGWPTLTWTRVVDYLSPPVKYGIKIKDETDNIILSVADLTDNTYTPTVKLKNGNYWWSVSVTNNDGIQKWSGYRKFTVLTPNLSTYITLSPTQLRVGRNEQVTITATLKDENNRPVYMYAGMHAMIRWDIYEDENTIFRVFPDTATDENGKASITFITPDVDNVKILTLVASYAGTPDNHFYPCSSSTTITVYPNFVSTLTITPASSYLTQGESTMITVILKSGRYLTGLENRLIQFTVENGMLSDTSKRTDQSGVATVTFTAPSFRENINITARITATYAGEDNIYLPVSSSVVIIIGPTLPKQTILTVTPQTFTIGQDENISFTVTLKDNAGQSIPGKALHWAATAGIVIKTLPYETDHLGRATALYFPPEMVWGISNVTITITFQGDVGYLPSSVTVTGKVFSQELVDERNALVSSLELRLNALNVSPSNINKIIEGTKRSVMEEKLGAAVLIKATTSTKMYEHPAVTLDVLTVTVEKEIIVAVDSSEGDRKSVIIIVDKNIMPTEGLKVLYNGMDIHQATSFIDALDPTNEYLPEYYLQTSGATSKAGEHNLFIVVVSIPAFSTNTITLLAHVPPPPIDFILIVIMFVIGLAVAVILHFLVFKKKLETSS